MLGGGFRVRFSAGSTHLSIVDGTGATSAIEATA
jgi:hypothetical protein